MKLGLCLLVSALWVFSACERDELRPLDRQLKDTRGLVLEDGPQAMTMVRSEVEHIQVPARPQEVFLDSLVTDYSFIPLETKGESLIGSIDKLIVAPPYLFILDQTTDKAFRFAMDGSFRGVLGHKGKGHSDYRRLSDLSVNESSKEVALLDLSSGYQLYYNYEGVFLRKQPLYYYYSRMEFAGDSLQVQYTGLQSNTRSSSVDCNELLVATTGQVPLYRGFSYPQPFRRDFHWGSARPLLRSGGSVYFHHLMSDTIWQVDRDVCTARFVLDFEGQGSLFQPSDGQSVTDPVYEARIKGKHYFFGHYLLSDRWAYWGIGTPNGGVNMLLYDRDTGSSFYGYVSERSNPVYRLLCNAFDFSFGSDGVVRVVEPFDALRIGAWLRECGQWERLSEQDQEFLSGLDAESNPVLLILRLRH